MVKCFLPCFGLLSLADLVAGDLKFSTFSARGKLSIFLLRYGIIIIYIKRSGDEHL